MAVCPSVSMRLKILVTAHSYYGMSTEQFVQIKEWLTDEIICSIEYLCSYMRGMGTEKSDLYLN